ncbi:DUF6766 family protein [Phyllobacterium endophyticum]|jgi:hypothetical protein|nr:DUF6766 family protein [Phyllobacterium endophyticum]MBB3237843.1 hypothetical protein [Phyllobacterium endophyticum]
MELRVYQAYDKDPIRMTRPNVFHRYAYAWLTLLFFGVSIFLHWLFGWYAYVSETAEHGQSPIVSDYLVTMLRDTFENWQSEFLQLLWQVVGLAYFLYLGSPASKENDDRMEAKIDALIRLNGGEKAEKLLAEIDETYLRKHGHAQPHPESA